MCRLHVQWRMGMNVRTYLAWHRILFVTGRGNRKACAAPNGIAQREQTHRWAGSQAAMSDSDCRACAQRSRAGCREGRSEKNVSVPLRGNILPLPTGTCVRA